MRFVWRTWIHSTSGYCLFRWNRNWARTGRPNGDYYPNSDRPSICLFQGDDRYFIRFRSCRISRYQYHSVPVRTHAFSVHCDRELIRISWSGTRNCDDHLSRGHRVDAHRPTSHRPRAFHRNFWSLLITRISPSHLAKRFDCRRHDGNRGNCFWDCLGIRTPARVNRYPRPK